MIVILAVQLSGCGTLLYPERRGQKAGSIDVGVALLDGLGLLFFLVPGIIAFAVDFSTGAIYLPPTRSADINKSMRVIKFDPKKISAQQIEKIVRSQTGQKVSLTQAEIKIKKLESMDEAKQQFAAVLPDIYQAQDTRISMR